MTPAVYSAMDARGWHFYRFVGDHGYRLMCAWSTTPAEIDAFLADLKQVLAGA